MILPGHRIALFHNTAPLPSECSSNTRVRLIYTLVSASLCLTIAGCSDLKVKQPAADSTPPSLVWNVFNHATSQQDDHPGSPTINAKRGESYRIILKARDPEGVKSIQINPSLGGGEKWWQCIDPPGGESLAQNKTETLGPMTQDLSPDQDGMVVTSVFLISELNFTMDCKSGWSFSSGSAKLTGQASNYFGGVTTEVINFTVAP